ncbi:3-deoxy-manno-octulosonate cytidylyltransferase [Candidatus Enterovibrio altilux]|uniref:3-deoxy-manno-octulosonate cytidylyltransferase n=1 Tax=Candidatus Enterovibrio altilux TaxID=1927128 RepID=A0A291BAI8_9GAMM|nr:3-deoxy-manno-octulosonate cytidylyltransferase [Candidatus Enterovibrio luxaltus]ATF10029.1 3-deoxy-manno-octulosonate cytidylyltransferase [Candidatus Enterovibrio luxaltus]
MRFTVVIPARYKSSRLPAKPLVDIGGKPMVQLVYEQSIKSGAEKVIVATDDQRIVDAVKTFGGEVCLTSPYHQSGTQRLAEVIKKYNLTTDEIVVNVQGDEPLLPPNTIHQVAENLERSAAPMATLAVNIYHTSEIFNPNTVKVVTDKDSYALYFSRAAIPWEHDHLTKVPTKIHHNLKRHIGIYSYRAGFINTYIHWPPSPIEHIECLEQLRVLWYGEKIHVDTAIEAPPAGVDTAEDLELVRKLVAES